MNQHCIITTNAGTGSTNLRATLQSNIISLKKKVRFDYNGIANIIALHSVQDQFKVSYSNWFGSNCNMFVVIKPDNTKMKFTISRKGLYYTDTLSLIVKPSKEGVFNQVTLVVENFTKYTKRRVKQRNKAWKFQVMFNNISTKNLLNLVCSNPCSTQ